MKINIQSPHFILNKSLTDFANKKINKLSEFNERIVEAEVYLKLDKSDSDDNKVCEIKLIVPGKILFASHRCQTFKDAIIKTVRALEQQIEKKKTKREGSNEKISMEDEPGEIQ